MSLNLEQNHKNIAEIHERRYRRPEFRKDMSLLTFFVQVAFKGLNVYEIGCGTGYWTEFLAKTATSLISSDIDENILEIARSKNYGLKSVHFEVSDALKLTSGHKYENLFGGFIWSGIPLENIPLFIDSICNSVKPGGIIVMIDDNYRHGISNPITHTDANNNTFELKATGDGKSHMVIKNYPREDFLRNAIEGKSSNVNYLHLKNFWMLAFKNTVR